MIIKGNTVGHPIPDPRKGLDMAGGIHMNGQKLSGIAAPAEDSDAVNWASVKDIGSVRQVEATLTAAGWREDTAAGWVQQLTVAGLTNENSVRLCPRPPVPLQDKLAQDEETAKIRAISRNGEVITFEAWEEKPELDIGVVVTIGTCVSSVTNGGRSGGDADLTGYATEQWVLAGFQPKGDYLTEHQDISGKLDADKLPEAVDAALAQAKESGEFDGYTPVKGTDYFTEADKAELVSAVIAALPDASEVSY